MKYLSIVLITGLLLVGIAVAEETEKPRCDMCGMFFDKSATRLTVTLTDGDEELNRKFESLGCLHNYVHENHPEAELAALSILDYATFGTDDEEMIDGFKAYYLFGTERLTGSMAPFIAAFATEKAATAAQEVLGGELTDFKGMRKLMAAQDESKDSGHHDGHMH